MNQKGGLILAQAGNMLTEALEAGLLREQEKAKTTPSSCVSCNKPTRSHKFGPLTMCHLCFERLTEAQRTILSDIIELTRMEDSLKVLHLPLRKRLLIPLSQWKNSGVLYCVDHDQIGKRCPDCDSNDAQGEADAEQEAAAAQAEHEAACREQAEFEDQQAADEAYYHNQGGPDG